MPLLFSIGIQGALEQVARSLGPGEHLCAFLDDIYMVCEPDRVRPLYDLLGAALHRETGIRLHTGKTRVWNRGGIVPARVEELGPDVWSGDGMKVLGNASGYGSIRFNRWWRNGSQKNAGCGRPFREYLISSVLGSCWSRVPTRGQTTRSELQSTHDDTTKACGPQCKILLEEVPGSEQELRSAEQVATLPPAHGRFGDEVCIPVRTCRVLGFVVGCPSHDPATHTSSG